MGYRIKNVKKEERREGSYYLIIVLMALFVVSNYIGVNILNYPKGLWFYTSLTVLCIVGVVRFRVIVSNAKLARDAFSKVFSLFLDIVYVVLFSVLFAKDILIPFDYLVVINSRDHDAAYVYADFVGVSKGRSPRSLIYRFTGDVYSLYPYDKMAEEIVKNGSADDYKIRFIARESFFGVYVFDDYRIVLK